MKAEDWPHVPKDYDRNLPCVKVAYSEILSRPLYYPTNAFALGLLILSGSKTFTKKQLEHLRDMGFPVEIGVRQVEIPREYK